MKAGAHLFGCVRPALPFRTRHRDPGRGHTNKAGQAEELEDGTKLHRGTTPKVGQRDL